jgi:hypothetical protein
MSYKIYLQNGIKNPEKKGVGLFRTFAFSLDLINYFLPMSVKYKDAAETLRRRKANKALVLFYVCFVCILLLSLVMD